MITGGAIRASKHDLFFIISFFVWVLKLFLISSIKHAFTMNPLFIVDEFRWRFRNLNAAWINIIVAIRFFDWGWALRAMRNFWFYITTQFEESLIVFILSLSKQFGLLFYEFFDVVWTTALLFGEHFNDSGSINYTRRLSLIIFCRFWIWRHHIASIWEHSTKAG